MGGQELKHELPKQKEHFEGTISEFENLQERIKQNKCTLTKVFKDFGESLEILRTI